MAKNICRAPKGEMNKLHALPVSNNPTRRVTRSPGTKLKQPSKPYKLGTDNAPVRRTRALTRGASQDDD